MDEGALGVAVTRFDGVVAQRGDRAVIVEPPFSSESSLLRVLRRLCHAAGSPLRDDEAVVERRLRDGSRLSAVVGSGAFTGPVMVIEKPQRVATTLEELVRRGTVSRAMATFLHHCASARVNMLVVGPRDIGTASVLASLVGVGAAASQVVAIEDLDDLAAIAPHAARLRLNETAQSDAGRMVTASARVPDVRLVVELTRPDVSAAVVDVTGEGSDGILALAHAPNARRALGRVTADVVAHRGGASAAAAREWVASAFDLVVEVGRLRDSRHRVLRIAEVVGVSGDEIRLSDVFTFQVERTAAGGAVEGTFNPAGSVPRVAEEVSARGFSLEHSMFTRPPSR